MKLKLMLAVTALLLCLSSVAAHADSLNLTLTNPVQSIYGDVGGTLTFQATVSTPDTNTGTVYLNFDNFSSTFALDDTGFLVGFPLSLGPNMSFTGDLFTLTVPANSALGTYVGSFSILGGGDSGALDTLATANFTVNVVPEPSSMILLVTGVAGGLTRFRKYFGQKS